MKSTNTIFNEPRRPAGAGRALVTGLKVGEEYPSQDPYEINKVRNLGRLYGVRFTKTPSGLRRIA